jgi:hypothetical protein
MTIDKKTTRPAESFAELRSTTFNRYSRIAAFGLIALAVPITSAVGAPNSQSAKKPVSLREEARAALRKAAVFYRTKVATNGGYAYFYTEDLTQRWGEGVGTATQVWVEPPGTPAVGMAYLKAYETTRDRYYLDAARETAHALVYGQLKSGGWSQTIDFDPNGSRANQYRNGKGKGANHSSLDDNQTQSAIRFLARVDKELGFKDAAIHEANLYALNALLKAQFPNGAFPQGWKEPVARHAVKKASYPENWPRIWPKEDYWNYYTLNDGLPETMTDTLLVAHEIYKDSRYLKALARLGDFLILAQMPDPQPAWAQQYNYEMQPTWARKFEPPAISGLESENAIKALMKIYRITGDRKYLQPIPKALAYLKKGRLADGRMARYYELQTNKPLYMNREPGVSGSSSAPGYYYFTYDDTNLPSHYGWKQNTEVDQLEKQYQVLSKSKSQVKAVPTAADLEKQYQILHKGESQSEAVPPAKVLEPQVRQIMQQLDAQGRWVTTYNGERLTGQPKFEKGFRYIGMDTFNRNVTTLTDYLIATRKK